MGELEMALMADCTRSEFVRGTGIKVVDVDDACRSFRLAVSCVVVKSLRRTIVPDPSRRETMATAMSLSLRRRVLCADDPANRFE